MPGARETERRAFLTTSPGSEPALDVELLSIKSGDGPLERFPPP